MRIGFVTCRVLPEPDHDEAPLIIALRSRAHEAVRIAWDDPDVDTARLADLDALVLRSCWNYHHDPEAFLAWCRRADEATRLLNPLDVVEANHHKGYLVDLEKTGLPVVPTRLVRRSATFDVEESGPIVIKPAVSAASWRTRRFAPDQGAEARAFAKQLLADGDLIVQPEIPGFDDPGERSLVRIGRRWTHAVRKRPRFAGDDEAVLPADSAGPGEIELAEGAIARWRDRLAYARVDLVPTDAGPLISEVELIEPSLYFPLGPDGIAESFVMEIERRIDADH